MPDYPPFGSLNPQAPPDRDAMGSVYGAPQSSVQWLRQYLPQSVGDFLSNREAQALAPTNAREIAGDVISTAGNIMPAGRFGVPRGGGIRAYHGSPYDFDRFDISKIGTGEGAQAYGHGLYFAENPAVAQEYKTQLSQKAMNLHDAPAIDRMLKAGASDEEIVAKLAERGNPYGVRELDAFRRASPGKMYEVNINASPEQFLDWDRPLSAQPQIMERLPMDKIQGALKSYGGLHEPQYVTGEAAYLNLGNVMEPPIPPDPPGYPKGWAYPRRGNEGAPAATAALRDAGIPGVRYLDQGSRSAGQGTNNYVLFRDDIVDILKKWGLIGGMAGAGAAAGSNDQAQAQPFGSLSPKPQTWKPPPG